VSKTRRLRCHRCGSSDLILREAWLEHAEYDGGLYIDQDGRIEADGEGFFSGGEIQSHLTEIECDGCGHVWRPRRAFSGSKLPARPTATT